MKRVICVANQKGGVGKTTTAISLAAGISRSGGRTLLVDLDPQCNATAGLGGMPSLHHPLVSGAPLATTICPTEVERLDLLPGCRSFSDVEQLVAADELRLDRMTRQLTSEIADYDHVLFDCPPSLGTLIKTALCWSTDVLIPIQCEYFAMEGLVQMIEVIKDAIRRKGELAYAGILLTMYDPALELTLEVDRQVRQYFKGVVYKTVIPRDVALCEAPSHALPIFDYAPRSRGARAYAELCLEVLEHV